MYLRQIPVPVGGLAPRSAVKTDAPRVDLSGQWRMRLLPTAEGSLDFIEPGFDDGQWQITDVPSHFGTPAYTNVKYPFPVDPPFVPDENPTGDFRTVFDTPSGFERAVLRFDGVDSCARVWLNG